MINITQIISTIIALNIAISSLAQYSDCDISADACTNPSFSVTPSGSGNVVEFTSTSTVSNPQTNPNVSPGNAGCLLTGEVNSTWLQITVSSSGTLEFSMGAAGSFNCFDWAMWPYNGTACADIASNSLPPVSCNWNGACTGITGMANAGNLPTGADQLDFENGLNVNAGDQFMVCFSNFSNASTNVPLNFFGTAGVTCGSVTNPFICYGETAVIAALDGVSYAWDQTIPGFISTNAAGDTAYVNPTVTTNYPVVITMGNGTTQNEVSTVTVYDEIIISTINVVETCAGDGDGSITSNAPQAITPATYTLSGAASATNSTGAFSNLSAGNYTIDVIDANGCTSQFITILNTGPPCCGMILSTTQIDNNCFGDCMGSSILDTNGTTGPAPIQWYDPSGTAIAGATNLNIANLCAGVYTVEVTDPLCTLTETVTITEPTELTFTTLLTDLTCFQNATGVIDISAAGGTAPLQYSIDNGVTFQPVALFNGLSAGNYDIIVMDANACQETASVTLIEPADFGASFVSTDNTCNSSNGPCDGVVIVTPLGGTGPYSYNWTGSPSNTSIAANLCVNSYDVTITDANGCATTILAMPIAEPAAITIDNITLTPPSCNNFCDGSIEVINSNASVFSIDNGVNSQPSNIFTNLCSGPIDIIISDANGCFTDSSINVINPGAVMSSFIFGPQPTTIFNPNISFTSTALNSASHYWTYGNGTAIYEVYELSPTISFPSDVSSVYEVCLIAEDLNLCVDTSCNEIVIDDEFFIFVPNAFSPKGDGFNDYFSAVLRSYDVDQFEMTIFNRWGQQVFFTESVENSWDGIHQSTPVEMGIYVWKIEVFSIADNELKQFFGHVSVVR
jgi:gliding motility-associated-like protein